MTGGSGHIRLAGIIYWWQISASLFTRASFIHLMRNGNGGADWLSEMPFRYDKMDASGAFMRIIPTIDVMRRITCPTLHV